MLLSLLHGLLKYPQNEVPCFLALLHTAANTLNRYVRTLLIPLSTNFITSFLCLMSSDASDSLHKASHDHAPYYL